MAMRNKGIGTASFVLIALVLALICFGTLGLYSAKMQDTRVDQAISASKAYHEAISELEIKRLRMERGEEPFQESVTIPIDDNRVLQVLLVNEAGGVQIKNQTIESKADWIEDTHIPVWDGKEK